MEIVKERFTMDKNLEKILDTQINLTPMLIFLTKKI